MFGTTKLVKIAEKSAPCPWRRVISSGEQIQNLDIMLKKPIFKYLLSVALLFVGNRIFNHASAWLGLAIIAVAFILIIKAFLKQHKTKKQNEED